jgi:hypothetical protein
MGKGRRHPLGGTPPKGAPCGAEAGLIFHETQHPTPLYFLQSLYEARGNTPMLNVLIRGIAALKLQEIGYQILSIRKITGKGIVDLTVRTPQGAPCRVGLLRRTPFPDHLRTGVFKTLYLKKGYEEAGIRFPLSNA